MREAGSGPGVRGWGGRVWGEGGAQAGEQFVADAGAFAEVGVSDRTKWVTPRSAYFRRASATSTSEPTSQVAAAPPPPTLAGAACSCRRGPRPARPDRAVVAGPPPCRTARCRTRRRSPQAPSWARPRRRHLGHSRPRVPPRLSAGLTDHGGDPQPELQRRVSPADRAGQRPQPLDPGADVVARLAQEQLHVGLGRGDPLRLRGGAAEVQLRMSAAGAP